MLDLIYETLPDVRVSRYVIIVVLSGIGSVSNTVETQTVLAMLFFLRCKFIRNCFIVLKYQAVLMVIFLGPPELGLELRYLSDLSI